MIPTTTTTTWPTTTTSQRIRSRSRYTFNTPTAFGPHIDVKYDTHVWIDVEDVDVGVTMTTGQDTILPKTTSTRQQEQEMGVPPRSRFFWDPGGH